MSGSKITTATSASETDTLLRDSAVLDLLSAHIAAALVDLENPQETIAAFFNDVVSNLESVMDGIAESSMQQEQKDSLIIRLSALRQGANKSILDFQAFDRVEQRLRNVQQSMHLIADNKQSQQPEQLDLIKSTYSMEHEQTLHKMMVQGIDRVELLEFCAKTESAPCDDNVELF